MRRAARSVWLVSFPNSELLDLCGPWEVLSHANDVLGRTAYACRLVAPLGRTLRTRHSLLVAGATPLRSAEASGLPEIGVVAGGSPASPLPRDEAHFVRWLSRRQHEVPLWVSICTGAFVLGEAGMLDGRRAMTHWRFRDALRARFPKANVVDEGIFERSGRIWSSAGITAGVDLSLALLEEHHGHAVAMAVAKDLVVYLRRSGNQAQFSAALQRQTAEQGQLRGLVGFVLEHLQQDLSVARLARSLGLSARSLSRLCAEQLGEPPATLVRRLRLEEARRLLEETDLPLKAIAQRTGLGDSSTLHRCFASSLQLSPAEYRARFAASWPGALR
jgi:transcriptional regulator GlxA family with amidase domain